MKILFFFMLVASTQAFSFSTLECSGPQNLVYTSHSKAGGAAPFAGMITHIEEIKYGSDVLFRKVTREGCLSDEFCEIQSPEIGNIGENIYFTFIEGSKVILASEGAENSSFLKETYAIKFLMEKESWMVCEASNVLYP